jgi:hypothetical protein
MAKDEVLAFKEFSKSKASEYSPWNPKNDPELNMWRKTAIKQVAKLMPKSEEIFKAIENDNEEAPVEEIAKSRLLEQATRESEADVSKLLGVGKVPDQTSTPITETP